MSDNTNLVPVNLEQLPSTQIGSDEQFADLAKSADYIGRLQLFTKGKAVNKKLVGPGNYGIPESDEEVIDLGDTIDIIPLARRPKAIDMTDSEAIIVNYDPETNEFKRIAAQSLEKESHCMYGPSFLVYERSTGRFLEFFCGNKSSRSEAKKVYPYLPLSQADIDAKAAKGEDVGDLQPHGPLPLTLKSRLVEKGTYSWHVPVVVKCATPFDESAADPADRQGNQRLLDHQGQRRGASPRADRPRPLARHSSCHLLPAGPAARPRRGYPTHPPHRSLRGGDVHHGRVSPACGRQHSPAACAGVSRRANEP